MFAFPFTCVFTLAFASMSVGGIVVRSSTGIPAVFRPLSRFATVLARVNVCRARVGRAGLPLLRESTCILSLSAPVPFSDDAVGKTRDGHEKRARNVALAGPRLRHPRRARMETSPTPCAASPPNHRIPLGDPQQRALHKRKVDPMWMYVNAMA